MEHNATKPKVELTNPRALIIILLLDIIIIAIGVIFILLITGVIDA